MIQARGEEAGGDVDAVRGAGTGTGTGTAIDAAAAKLKVDTSTVGGTASCGGWLAGCAESVAGLGRAGDETREYARGSRDQVNGPLSLELPPPEPTSLSSAGG